MIDYNALKQEIIETLEGRPNGTQIQPDKHQHYSLNMLDYIRELELSLQSSLIGFANTNTIPIQPDNARVSYVAAVSPNTTNTYTNFYDENGISLSITSNNNQGLLAILIWNMQFWSYEVVPAGQATYYSYNIRKTYNSISDMNADVNSPVATDGTAINIGEMVSVVNLNDESENGIYTYEGVLWRWQCSFNVYEEDINHNPTDVNETIMGNTLRKEINLGLLNNPIYSFQCDSDIYQFVSLKIIFNKLNSVKIIINNVGNSTLTYNNIPDLLSSNGFLPVINFIRSGQDINTIQPGERLLIELTAYNFIDENNNIHETNVIQTLKVFDISIPIH